MALVVTFPPALRSAIGPLCIGLAVWCAAGRISLASSDSASIRLAVAAPWWFSAIATAAAALVPAWRRSPLLTLPALLSVLPWLPVPLPAVALVWTGPLAWVPIGLCVIAAVVAAGAGRPFRVGGSIDAAVHWQAAAGVTLALALAAAWVLSPRLPAGDEPHYLVITQSLLKDADLRIENNHRARDYAAYFDAPLAPDFLRRGRDSQIYSIHAPGLPVLVLPAFWLFGYRGAQATVLILAALVGGIVWKAGWRATRSIPAAWFAWAAIAGSVTFLVQSVTVFPDGPAMLAVAASVLALLALTEPDRESPAGNLRLAGISVLLAALPWLHTRFAILSAGFGLLIAWAIVRESPVPVPQRKQRLAWFLAAPIVSAIAWFAYFQIIYGTPNPAAPYGQRPETSWAFVPGGLAGLLFDQQFGLLMYAPVLAVAAFGLAAGRALPPRHVARATSIVSVLYLCVVATYWMWWAGVPATPARFAAVVLPGFAIPLALAWNRAGVVVRAVFVTLLVLSIAITATVLGVGRGSLAWNVRGESALWLEWLGPVVDLARGSPSFFWRLTPENLFTEIPFFLHILGWFAAGSVVAAAGWAIGRRFRSSRNGSPTTAWSVALGFMAMQQVGWWLSGVPGPSPIRSQIAILDTQREGRQPVMIAPFSLGRAPDLAGMMRLSPSEAARPGASIWGTVQGLPAGTYELRVVTSRPRQGELMIRIGETTRPWRTLTVLPLSRQAFLISLPADVSSLTIQPDASLKQVGGNLELVPLMVRRGGTSHALGVVRYGTTDVFFLDQDAFPEEGGFWVQGGRTTEVVLAAGAGRATVPVLLRNGGSANNVRLQIDAEPQTVALQAGEERQVAVPVSGPDGVVRLRIGSEAGFRPSEAVSGDRRYLGVWVEIR